MWNAFLDIPKEYNDINNYFLHNRVIVIGSHPSVLDHKVGHFIDQFDVIVRFNTASYEGHEEHLGSRTDIRFLNRCGLNEQQGIMRKFRESLRGQKVVQCFAGLNDLNLDESNEIWNLNWNALSDLYPKISCGRVGFFVIAWLVELGVKPTIHGFELNTATCANMSNYTGNNEGNQGLHQPTEEIKILNKFVESGAIKILDTGNE